MIQLKVIIPEDVEDAMEAQTYLRPMPLFLFKVHPFRLALPLEHIAAVQPYAELMPAHGLPKIFAGFLSYDQDLVPCLHLDALLDQKTVNPPCHPLILIFRRHLLKGKRQLAFLIDQVDARFMAKTHRPLSLASDEHLDHGQKVHFGEDTYTHLHPQVLLQAIETHCLQEVKG